MYGWNHKLQISVCCWATNTLSSIINHDNILQTIRVGVHQVQQTTKQLSFGNMQANGGAWLSRCVCKCGLSTLGKYMEGPLAALKEIWVNFKPKSLNIIHFCSNSKFLLVSFGLMFWCILVLVLWQRKIDLCLIHCSYFHDFHWLFTGLGCDSDLSYEHTFFSWLVLTRVTCVFEPETSAMLLHRDAVCNVLSSRELNSLELQS